MCCFLGFGIFFILIGISLVAQGISGLRQSKRAAKWPTTPATISRLELEKLRDSDGYYTSVVKVQYQYTVDGVVYTSSRLAIGYPGNLTQNQHDEIYRKIKDAKVVLVRYDPTTPSESCLSYGIHNYLISWLILGVIVLLFSIGATIFICLAVSNDHIILNNLMVD